MRNGLELGRVGSDASQRPCRDNLVAYLLADLAGGRVFDGFTVLPRATRELSQPHPRGVAELPHEQDLAVFTDRRDDDAVVVRVATSQPYLATFRRLSVVRRKAHVIVEQASRLSGPDLVLAQDLDLAAVGASGLDADVVSDVGQWRADKLTMPLCTHRS